MKTNIVIDTNVIVSAIKSRNGASFKLMEFLGNTEEFQIAVTVPLFFEYEYALVKVGINRSKIDDYLGWICLSSKKQKVNFLWRPFLKDVKDDCVLEAALNCSSKFIISYNKNDFNNVNQLGIVVIDPKEFLKQIGVIK
ncbi:MAG: PIN domain-containing protein [Candidatus Kapabacteria bacterium]|nr:PIN domain-containing protein [Ignavibacteriota bacterium]MCW5884073.1 PIN domain-containing protein [Candidatus Kapabacteria bacterium]